MLSPRTSIPSGSASTSVLFDTGAREQREARARPHSLLKDPGDVEVLEQDLCVLRMFSDTEHFPPTTAAAPFEAASEDMRACRFRPGRANDARGGARG
jgi:hypothetical protein